MRRLVHGMLVVALTGVGLPASPARATGTERVAGGRDAPTAAPEMAGTPAQELFDRANERYLQRDYEAAARLYEGLVEARGIDDPVVLHNLGNARFRTRDYGLAILYYRRGLHLDPTGRVAGALEDNLQLAREVLRKRYRTEEGASFIYAHPGGLLYRLTHLVSPRRQATALLAGWWLLLALLVARRLLPRARALGTAAVPVGVAVVLLAGLLAGRSWSDTRIELGVVVDDRVVLREGRHPDAQGSDLPEGMEVRIVERGERWTRVELPNEREGWVRAEDVRRI